MCPQSGDITLESATFDGTIVARVSKGGLFDGGLQKLVIVNPELDAGAGSHGLDGPLLDHPHHAGAGRWLPGDDRWRNGLNAAPGGGITVNSATVQGTTWPVTCYPSVDVLFARPPGPPPARIFRGDANSDGKLDVSDALWIVGFLFLGSEAPYCPEAADTNDDSAFDLSDAGSILQSLFVTGLPLPPPERCEDPQPDIVITECPPYSTNCP